jgi:hypothetical protein
MSLTKEEIAARRQAKRAERKHHKGRHKGSTHRTTAIEPRADLIPYLDKRGPVEGESRLAFKCRLAHLARGREMWLDAFVAGGQILTRACRILEIASSNTQRSLKQFGLTRDLLFDLAEGKVQLDHG